MGGASGTLKTLQRSRDLAQHQERQKTHGGSQLIKFFWKSFAAAALASGVIIAPVAYFMKVEAGDILSYFGALVGTGFAVMGAVAIEDRKRALEAKEKRKPVLDAIDDVRSHLAAIRADASAVLEDHDDLLQAIDVLSRVLSTMPPVEPTTIVALDDYNAELHHFVGSATDAHAGAALRLGVAYAEIAQRSGQAVVHHKPLLSAAEELDRILVRLRHGYEGKA
jgi:hypothetical protein